LGTQKNKPLKENPQKTKSDIFVFRTQRSCFLSVPSLFSKVLLTTSSSTWKLCKFSTSGRWQKTAEIPSLGSKAPASPIRLFLLRGSQIKSDDVAKGFSSSKLLPRSPFPPTNRLSSSSPTLMGEEAFGAEEV